MFEAIKRLVPIILSVALISCGGGGGGSGRSGGDSSGDFGCDGSCPNQNLSVAEVQTILSQAIKGARSVNANGTFAVVDRVGNVLGVYQMSGATMTTTINGKNAAVGGLEGVTVPATLAAISKAGTGAYLSSQGNAFSTRTASQIIQEHFNPGERNQPGGPLFGVQFSQLPCSDIMSNSPGPNPMPLGLSGDPGGLPLYKQGDLVGGIGVEFDGLYTIDRNITDTDDDPEERVALIATLGFEAPSQRVAPNVNIGKSLRYTDIGYEDLGVLDDSAENLESSSIVPVALFFDGNIRGGATFGDPGSGIAETVRAGQPAAVLVNASGGPRFPTHGGVALPGGVQLNAAEVDALLDSALLTSLRARAAIRRPLDVGARVSIWVVDTQGNPLGFTRGQDAPVFGIDVSLQKARTATFLSSPDAAAALSGSGFGDYVARAMAFTGGKALSGNFAFTDRAGGNLSRPFFTDGIDGNLNGPFSLPFPGTAAGKTWSPFNDGLQLDLVFQRLVQPILQGSVPSSCTSLGRRLGNGIQIFPGSVPLYRHGILVGGLGISGDGIDQDDLTCFYGASRAGLDYAGHTDIGDPQYGFNAPKEIRADLIDTLAVEGTRLRYVNCPEAPFSGDNDQNVCDGF